MSLFSPDASGVDLDSARGLRVAVIGGGAIGLGIAWRLAEAGASVDVFERGQIGRGASYAAAGMLAAGVETEPGEEALALLGRHSQALWPDFARRLEAASGVDIGYRTEGTLSIALTRDDVAKLRFTYEFQRRAGVELDWLSGPEARTLEPSLSAQTVAAMVCRADHQVDNRLMTAALRVAVERAGGVVREHVSASLDLAGGRAVGVVVEERAYPANLVILAAGAWSDQLQGLPRSAIPPVRPIKGQMIALRMDRDAPLLSHVVWAPGVYLVPREDGRLILGATVEEKGFEDTLTAGGLYGLLDGAWRALPGIEELPVDEMWVGHRPGSRDDAPIIGACSVPGLILATGHHRNGILLTPITAWAVAQLALTGTAPAEIVPFAIDRFAAHERRAS